MSLLGAEMVRTAGVETWLVICSGMALCMAMCCRLKVWAMAGSQAWPEGCQISHLCKDQRALMVLTKVKTWQKGHSDRLKRPSLCRLVRRNRLGKQPSTGVKALFVRVKGYADHRCFLSHFLLCTCRYMSPVFNQLRRRRSGSLGS